MPDGAASPVVPEYVERALQRAHNAGMITGYSFEPPHVRITIGDGHFPFVPHEASEFIEH